MNLDIILFVGGIFLFLILSFIIGRWKNLSLALLSIVLAVLMYLTVGMITGNCSRFNSVPFGGCGYSDKIIELNISFWIMSIFSSLIFLKKYVINKNKT